MFKHIINIIIHNISYNKISYNYFKIAIIYMLFKIIKYYTNYVIIMIK